MHFIIVLIGAILLTPHLNWDPLATAGESYRCNLRAALALNWAQTCERRIANWGLRIYTVYEELHTLRSAHTIFVVT